MASALEVLQKNSNQAASELPRDLLVEVSKFMIPIEVDDGHILVKEGEDITDIVVVETGRLIRSKLSVPEEEKADILKEDVGFEQIREKSIVVDEILSGTSPTGVYHNFEAGCRAFATISASGPCRVWLLPGDKFRSVVSKPEYCMVVMAAMAKRVRMETKSVRGLLNAIGNDNFSAGDDEKNLVKILSYDSTSWVVESFDVAVEKFNEENDLQIQIEYTTERLTAKSASYASGHDIVCLFVNDTADSKTIKILSENGVKMIANRCAGFDRVDTKAALAYGVSLARVPAYSPYAVAEFAISLLMGINRKIAKASARVKMSNFSLDMGLMGCDIHGKTVGVMGTGKIGQILCNIVKGFGANLICFDVFEADAIKAMGGKYVTKDEIFSQSDIIFLMMPLLPPTKHTINEGMLDRLKPGVLLINSSRGGLVDTVAVLNGIQTGIIGGYGADVYENESDYFFQDWSAKSIPDPTLVALLGHNKVLLTAHQAFFTQEAVDAIVNTTLTNVKLFHDGKTMYDHPNNFLPKRD